jgi:DNA-binding PadR family transcriptional regulator
MARKRKVGNLMALAVLWYLEREPMHAYEIARSLRRSGDARSIRVKHGSLYMVVQQLVRAGFIVEQETTRSGRRPERTVYALTDTGREEGRDWLRELIEEPEREYPHFVAGLSLIHALPRHEFADLLRRRLARLEEQRAEAHDLVAAAAVSGTGPLPAVQEEYRLAMLEAESAFVARVVDRLHGVRMELATGR